jgi:hypothetical protein
MSDRVRNTEIPLYIWIKSCGSILKLDERTRMRYSYSGKEKVLEVLERFVRLYAVDVSKFNQLVDDLIRRYRSTWNAMPDDIRHLAYSNDYQGLVRLEKDKQYKWADNYVYTADYSDAYVELKYMESCNLFFLERQTKLIAEEQRKPEHRNVRVVAVREKVKVVNRLKKSWYQYYFNLQKKPAKLPKALEEIEELVEVPAMHPPGVYFLCHGNKVVYVGQSSNPSARIAQHQADKQFNRVFMIPTNNLDEVETMYIKKFKPKYNKAQNYS